MATQRVDMSPAVLDLVGVRSGDANRRVFRLTQDGNPWDLAGATLAAQARRRRREPDPPALVAAIEIIDSEAGEFSVAWPGEDVAVLLERENCEVWNGVWDLEIGIGDEDPLTVIEGRFNAVSDVTRL